VSYDPTRELYVDYNAAFARYWKAKTGDDVVVKQSHGGSGAQARSVIDGLQADVVTLALAADIDSLHVHGDLLPADWQSKLPENSTPYTSTIVLLVRKGNPKHIKDWDDVVRPDVSVITPNPKTSGGARWAYLAAWGYAERKYGSKDKAREFITASTRTCRCSTPAPAVRRSPSRRRRSATCSSPGKTRRSWPRRSLGRWEVRDGVVPSFSILAEPPVAVVEKVVERKGTAEVAKAYLEYLYSDEGQEIAGRNYYRPRNPAIAAKYATCFPSSTFSRSTRCSAAGRWRRRPTLPTAACSTRSTRNEPAASGDGRASNGPAPRAPAPSAFGNAMRALPRVALRRRSTRIADAYADPKFTLHPARLRVVAGLHGGLSRADRPHPAVRGVHPHGRHELARLRGGRQRFPRVIAAYRLSFGASLAAGLVNMVFGLACRLGPRALLVSRQAHRGRAGRPALRPSHRRRGHRAHLASIRRTAGWGAGSSPWAFRSRSLGLGVFVALTFIGLPFVVRTVQPVLQELEPEIEEASSTLGASRLADRHPDPPARAPALAPDGLRAGLRAGARGIRLGRLHIGQHAHEDGNRSPPDHHQAGAVRLQGATAIAVVMLVSSFVLLLLINLLQKWSRRYQAI
jgi:sulfate/thiosulfate transport system substrate-binding protein